MPRVATLDQLASMYRAPAERVRTKKRDRLDDGLCAVLAASPFVLLATADADGRCDVSPRGGPPGFVKALDDRHVALPDLNGNNLVDSLRNIVANPHAGLLVVVPGQNETLRIDGPAYLTTDDDVLDRFTTELRRPTLAVVIETAAVFTHCAKSFRRGARVGARDLAADRAVAGAGGPLPPARSRRELRGLCRGHGRPDRGRSRRRPTRLRRRVDPVRARVARRPRRRGTQGGAGRAHRGHRRRPAIRTTGPAGRAIAGPPSAGRQRGRDRHLGGRQPWRPPSADHALVGSSP